MTLRPSHGVLFGAALLVGSTLSARARADNTLSVVDVKLDRPTLTALGVQLLINGDDNFNASVTLRYRVTGSSAWKDGLPLFRVRPETLQANVPPPQFAGSVFDLAPDTSYDLELHAVDPDGGDVTKSITGKTRPVPKDPPTPHVVKVDPSSLAAALSAAAPGDVITLSKGTYAPFSIGKGGTDGNPVVVRGESTDGVIVDGGNCVGCNVVEIYADYVHLDHMTIQNGERGIRWQKTDAIGGVARYLHVKDVFQAIHGKGTNLDFYIADNVCEGRLKWPLNYGSDPARDTNSNWDGIVIAGSGHVVAYNKLSGFSDSIQTNNYAEPGRANDFYGNDSLWNYDDGIELDSSGGNVRCMRNRWTNTFDALSYQPVYGGPSYTMRNVIVNVTGETTKLHSLGGGPPGSETSGNLLFNNTFVKVGSAFFTSSGAPSHAGIFENNLFVGTATGTDHTLAFDQPIVDTTNSWDFNGYQPDGKFEYGSNNGAGGITYDNFAAVLAAKKYDVHSLVVAGNPFASGLVAPSDPTAVMAPADARLAAGSGAIDKGTNLPNVTDGYSGAAPDLGAIEFGCALPVYGPRPEGKDESNSPDGCGTITPGGDAGVDGGGTNPDGGGFDGGVTRPDGGGPNDDGGDGDQPGGSSSSGGCGCHTSSHETDASIAFYALFAAVFVTRARRGISSRSRRTAPPPSSTKSDLAR